MGTTLGACASCVRRRRPPGVHHGRPTPYRERFIKVKRCFPCLMWRKRVFFSRFDLCLLITRPAVGPRFSWARARSLITRHRLPAYKRARWVQVELLCVSGKRGGSQPPLGAIKKAPRSCPRCWMTLRSIHRSPGQSQMVSIHPTRSRNNTHRRQKREI